jgi:hypothetical protein
MTTGWIVAVTALILVAVVVVLVGGLVRAIAQSRGSKSVRRIWANFGLSIAFCGLFLLTWAGQAVTEWGVYRDEQRSHGEAPTAAGFVVAFGQSTLENWQSEFLQLFSFVVLSAVLIHRDSAESKDGQERMERKIDDLRKRLDELDATDARR